MEGVPSFKFRSRDPDHAHFRGQFVAHWLAHVTVSVCTKYEVSIFGHSKDIKVTIGLSRTVSEINGDVRRKSHENRQYCSYSRVLNAPAPMKGFPWNLVSAHGVLNASMMGLSDGRKSIKIGLVVLIL